MEKLYGRNAVLEVLRADRRRVSRLILAKDMRESANLKQIIQQARTNKIPIERVDRNELDSVTSGHQGVIAETSPFSYSSVADILKRAREVNQPPLIVLLDVLQDPQNVGTLMRTAVAVGAHGVILPPRRGVGITPGVVAASAGMCEHVLVAVANIAQTIRQLKKEDVWIIGLEASAQAMTLDRLDISGGIGLVIGGEEKGMRRLVRDSCDALVRLPMRPGVDSLNAAVAGSIVLYALWEARGYSGAENLPQ
jgi:23S rRNA (guanosine2251-2'-O)-methyltransferase